LGETSATDVTIQPEAVIIHGYLIAPQKNSPPKAAISLINIEGEPFHKILHAGDSWAPNGMITSYQWNHSDGTSRFILVRIQDL